MTTDSSIVAHGFARTPITPSGGDLSGWHPVDLAAAVAAESLSRAGLTPDQLDELVVGCAEPVGAQGADVARAIVLSRGWPSSIGGLVVERAETSGSAALHLAAASVRTGESRRVAVVGLGMASTVPPGAGALNRAYGAPWGESVTDRFSDRGGLLPPPRGAELAAATAGIERAELEAWADRSLVRHRAAPASSAIVAVGARPGDASPLVRRGDPVAADVLRDWGPTEDLPPAFDHDGLLTSATFAPPSDGVTAMIVESTASDPSVDGAVLLASGRAAGDPHDPTGAIAVAVRLALARGGGTMSDVDLIEGVESNAATIALVARALNVDPDSVNRGGGALATGDAGAAEELRVVTDAICRVDPGQLVLTLAAGPTGSAATLWRRVRIEYPRARP